MLKMKRILDASDAHTKELRNDIASIGKRVATLAISF